MKDRLVRFGVAMEGELLGALDHLVELRQSTRSKLLSDLARAEVDKVRLRPGVAAFAALTLVYDHHVRDLTERLTELQHQLGDQIRASLHVHLNHDECLEVIIMRGRSDELQTVAGRLLGLRGVKHGEIVLIPEPARAASKGEHAHPHPHGEGRGLRRPEEGAAGRPKARKSAKKAAVRRRTK